ncbi:ComEC/Rec2 family competence protein [Salidesulfovibrio brasiliensis]|uniref:ComEC/Rec2 family competence protein n=1 Tax=Salidesulfovibrio brasiliensis TaxID=221711 RepID=UPI0006D13803|nr:hypothetical protein [Salidesulfovibrio brasiliensis]
MVLRLEWNDRVLALLTGDIEQKAISDILRSGVSMKSQVLVMPHHGSKGSSPEMIVPAVGPEIGLISCRRDNRYGFPHPSVLGALRDVGALILRTDIDGAAWLCWDDDMGALRIETAVSNRKNGRMQLFLPVY